jgi:non-ribosomal peptide synthase protein (TIGR01720 family)
VGWFTSIFPLRLELSETAHPGERLKGIKEQLRAVPQRGIGYGLLRYLTHGRREELQKLPQAQVAFNYLGQFGQGQVEGEQPGPARELAGPDRSPKAKRRHLLEINSSISAGRLAVHWTYSAGIHRQETIERLALAYLEALRALIAHCQSPEAGGYTPSDFPDIELSQEKLDNILAELNLGLKEDKADEQ